MPKGLKWTLTVIIFVGLTLALYFIGFKGEWIQPLVQSTGWFGFILYILIQVIITTLCCFVPATTFTFTLMSVQIFKSYGLWVPILISVLGCWISSIVMFLVGRYGGTKLVDWLVGKEDRIKAQNLISDRATVLVPVMLACPFFPDDALCMVSGMTKMNFWYFIVMSLITRSIGVVSTGLLGNDATVNYIKSALGNNIVLWVMLINLILFDVYVVWKVSGKLEQIIKKKREAKEKAQKVENKIEEDTVINTQKE